MNLVICDSNVDVSTSVAWNTYRPIKAELIVHYDQGFLTAAYVPYITCTLHDPAIHLPSILISNIWWQVQFTKLYIMLISPITYYF
jgi:hypothetical protein